MKIFSLVLSLFTFWNCAYASSSNFQLYVSFNMNECPACYNSLRLLKQIDSQISLNFVFPAEYRADSADITSNFKLPKNGKFFWSDSLVSKFSSEGEFSYVTLAIESGGNPLKFRLKQEFNDSVVTFFNNLVKDESSLAFDSPVFSMANKSLTFFGLDVCVVNQLKNQFSRINIFTGKEDLNIKMSDKLSQAAFKIKFENDTAWYYHRKIINDLSLPKFQMFKEMYLTSENIYLTGVYTYFRIYNNGKDTGEARFEAIHKFDNRGNLLGSYVAQDETPERMPIVQDLLKDRAKNDTVFYFSNTSPFIVENDTTILLGLNAYASKNYSFPSYFLARFGLNEGKQPIYFFKNYVKYVFPNEHKNVGYNFYDARFTNDAKFFMLPLSDKIYSVSERSKPIDLELFPEQQPSFQDLKLDADIITVRHDKQNFYVLYNEKGTIKYAKINIKTKKKDIVDISSKLGSSIARRFVKPDFFDNNFIIFPSDVDKLKRFRVFN